MPRYDRPDEPFYIDEVIGSNTSYHRPTCHIIRLISKRKYRYKKLHNYKEALELGLSPCQVCNPYCPPGEPISELPEDEAEKESLPVPHSTIITATQIADRRRVLLRILDEIELEAEPPKREGVAARINRLKKAEVIPREVASCMLTFIEFRNIVEYNKGKELSTAESATIEASWSVVKEWAANRKIEI